MTISTKTIPTVGQLPAGRYYVGDPCYLFRDDKDWQEFLKLVWAAEGHDSDLAGYLAGVIVEYCGHQCFVSATNTGDGCYRDQYRAEYPVDAGMIAAIPLAACGPWAFVAGSIEFPKIFKVGADVGRWLDKGKRIKVGHIVIKT